MLIDEGFSLSAVTDFKNQSNRNLEHFWTSKFPHFKFEFIPYIPCKPFCNQAFSKSRALIECGRKKTWVSTVLTDTPTKVALQAEVEACAKHVTCNRLSSDGQEK
jgi:hypothetical protein